MRLVVEFLDGSKAIYSVHAIHVTQDGFSICAGGTGRVTVEWHEVKRVFADDAMLWSVIRSFWKQYQGEVNR